ncbi:uncharacterized protein LOC131320168 [Rhododendron vialii]|uniref:uncharacterized protein LOC131320168 n=1 Tax=Rhododendron vialii TaxID=182163 RepID=UPI00265DFD3F|nr:uncharacterized protein LOC131320168 [Rhododendron vialii]
MLGGIFGLGFSAKCKSLIKPIRARIDARRKGNEATERFLKNNLAQLLANRHYCKAYEKTEEYITELNCLLRYDFIEEACVHILKQLSAMQKRSECPDECIEPVGTLVYAAGKFPDFLELRMLRDTFKERYGKSLERFVNQEFVSNLASKPTVEKKIKALEDIALEFSIKWDSEDLKQKLANPSASGDSKGSEQKMANPYASGDSEGSEQKMAYPCASELRMTNPSASWDSRVFEQMLVNPSATAQVQPKRHGPFHYEDDTEKSPKETETLTIIYKRMTSSKDRNELAGDKYRVNVGCRDVNLSESEKLDQRYSRSEDLTRKGRLSIGSGLSSGSEQSSPTRDNYDIIPRSRGKFTQFNNELWSSTGKEESAAKINGKRTEFANGRYAPVRRTTIV